MKTHLTAFAILAALLAVAPSCSNDEGSGDGDGNGDGDGTGMPTILDLDDDGVPDAYDSDGDGEPEAEGIGIDEDDDGTYDGLDLNGNGNIDFYFPDDSPGDGDAATGDGDGDDECTESLTTATNNPGAETEVGEDFEQCAAEAREVENRPADIIFMVDQSISMIQHTVPDNVDGAPTRWELLRNAMLEFVRDEASQGLRVGLQFFPQAGNWEYEDGSNSGVSCDVADYSELAVPVAELPGNADAFEEAYPEQPQGGLTPSIASLEGALSAAREWAGDGGAGRGVAVVWVTDGYPTVCDDQTVTGLADLAESYNNPEDGEARIPTFVVGLGPTANLTQVARAGGTGDGFFVADEECDPIDTLIKSLQRVANNPTLCRFNMPEPLEGGTVDLDQVNMQYTPVGGPTETIGQASGPGACSDTGGWYYDDPEDPTEILVCPQTCGLFGDGQVSVVAGCETVTAF